jgi:hypothetical protein
MNGTDHVPLVGSIYGEEVHVFVLRWWRKLKCLLSHGRLITGFEQKHEIMYEIKEIILMKDVPDGS